MSENIEPVSGQVIAPKNVGGRPLKYKTVKELQIKIDEYFDYCDNKTKEIHSEKLGDMVLPDPEPYTMAGLAYALEFDSRQSLINYSNRDGFMDAIKRARNKVEADMERRMSNKETFTPGLIFSAKNNFGWTDKIQTDVTTGGEKLNATISPEQAEQLLRLRAKRESDPS